MKEIPNFDGYFATHDGRIWSSKTNKFLSKNTKSKGYSKLNLYDKDGNVKNVRVCRMIWQAFNGLIPNGYEINHKNCIRDDDSIDNLELVTHRENLLYGNGVEKRRKKQIAVARRKGESNFARPITITDVQDCGKYHFSSRVELAEFLNIKPKHLTHKIVQMRNKGSNRITLAGRDYIVTE